MLAYVLIFNENSIKVIFNKASKIYFYRHYFVNDRNISNRY